MALERYKNGTYKDEQGKFLDLRPWVKSICKTEQEASNRVYNSLICDNAVREAKTTFRAVLAKNYGKTKAEGLSSLHFKSKKGDIHSFRMCRLPAGLHPAVNALGEITLTETVPPEAVDQAFTVTFNKGRWWLNVQKQIRTKAEKQGPLRCVAVDPGVRTFATTFTPEEVIIAGENLAKTRLYPLMKAVDHLLSQRQKIWNTHKGMKFNDLPQWARDRLTHIKKQIYRLKCKKDDLVSDLHLRLAHELTEKYDVIFLPQFKTKGMVKRKAGRTLRRNTCRQMLDLCHYQFKLFLKWVARKKGKYVWGCTEHWTSKTLSYSGRVLDNLGGKKTLKEDGMIVDRDINAARGIFIKVLTELKAT